MSSLKRTSTLTRRQTTHDEEKSASEKRADQLADWRRREQEDLSKASPPPAQSSKRKKISFDAVALLLASTSEGDLKAVQELLKNGLNVNSASEEGLSALHEAAAQENLEMMDFLLANGANINAQDNEGWTPLHAVCHYGFAEVASFLIQRGADPGIINFDDELPLDLVEDDDDLALVIEDAMTSRGIDEKKANELRNADLNRMLKDIEEATKADPSTVNGQADDGTTLLHIACGKGYLAVVLTLLDKGANPNVLDAEGWSPLHVAAYWGKTLLLEPLATFGADLEMMNNDNETPLDVADNATTREKLEELREKFRKNKKAEGVLRRNSSALRRGHKSERKAMHRHSEDYEFPHSP